MKKILSAFIVLIAIYSNNVTSEQVIEETVVVTSALVDTSSIDQPLYVIDGSEILDGATTSLGEAIDGYLGISIADYGSGVGQPIIRGMSGSRVKILKNGMVNRDVSFLGADHLNDLDLNDINQIEIVKGPSSLLYANGSIGGIINVVDDCIAQMDFDGAEFAAGYESQSVNDGNTEYFNYKNNINGFNFNFGFKNTEFGNYEIPHGAVLHEEDHDEDHGDEHGDEHMGYLENTDYLSEATKFGVSKTGDWGYFGISVDNIESIYGIPFHGDEHGDEDHGDEDHGDEEGHDEHEGERIFSTTDSESFTLKGSYNVNGALVNKVDYTFRSSDYSLTEAHAEEHDDEDHGDEHGDEDHGDEDHGDEHEDHAPTVFLNDSKEYGVIFDVSKDDLSRKISFNFVDEDTSIFGEEAFMNPANSREITLGYFMSKEFDAYSVDFGLRLDQIGRTGSVSHEDGDNENFNIEDTTSSFALNIGRNLNDNLEMTLGFASVERLPSVIELFMNGPHLATGRFEVGDPNLKSETSNNFDITFNYEKDNYYAYASFFINDVDNYIALMDEDEDHHDDHDDDHDDDHGDDDHGHGNLIHANYMQENAEFDGYEIEIGRTVELGSGELTLSYGRDVVNAQFSDGHNVPRINPARNIYSLSYKQNDLIFKLHLKDVEKQNDFGEGESATEGYQMLDSRLTKTFSPGGKTVLKVSIFGNNLLDEVARNHSSFVKDEVPLPGRNYGVKFNLTF